MKEMRNSDAISKMISLSKNPFFAPPGGDLGDTFPIFYKGECHLFALQPPHVAHYLSRRQRLGGLYRQSLLCHDSCL